MAHGLLCRLTISLKTVIAARIRDFLRDILKRQWGFDGVAVSDWGGVHNTDAVLEGGLDLEMGTGTDGVSVNMNAYDSYYMANPYLERLRDGRESVDDLNDRVRRILRTIFPHVNGSFHLERPLHLPRTLCHSPQNRLRRNCSP